MYQETLEANPRVRNVLACTARKLGLETDDTLRGLVRYDNGVGTYDNGVYDDVRVRSALYLKYFVAGSYHVERQNVLIEFLKNIGQAKNIVDIGYGAPGLYVEQCVLAKSDVVLTLMDKFDNAEIFSRAFFSCTFPETNWEQRIHFQNFDLDEMKSPGSFDAYILFDSIEHAKHPSECMDMLVQAAPMHAQFLLSIPICSKTGIEDLHFIEWLTDEDAERWLQERGLRIEERRTVTPTAIDLWAEGFAFHNLIVRCTKPAS